MGCAAGYYLTQKMRQLRAPTGGDSLSTSEWLRRNDLGSGSGDLNAEKVIALGNLAKERASDLLRSPLGDHVRERVVALFESAIASQQREPARRT